ncbi:Nucleolar pre-ribosomal-associated protein 1, n-terminal, partial [Globisporangium splendens]
MAQVVLREFLLAVERPKQPLDAAIDAFAQALVPAPATSSSDGNSTSKQQQLLLATKFLEIHPQGDVFFHVWPDQHGAGTRWEKRDSIATFFRVLVLLLRVQGQRNAQAAETIALKVIREKNTHLEKVLTWSDKPLIEYEALELMTALVGVNGAVAREFVRLFNFQSPSFAKLAAWRMKKPEAATETETPETADVNISVQKPTFQVREAYVRLVLALTACPDKSVHRFAIKEGGLTASLFKAIDGDSVEMLSQLFSRLKELVLHNASVETKAKLVIFNAHCVHQVLPLLQSEDESIAQMALDVLNALFFDDDTALYVVPKTHALRFFLSKTAATSATSSSSDEPSHTSEQAYAVKVIRNAIATIGVNEYIRSAYAQALIASFITKYPGLLAEYLHSASIQLEPKPVYRWFCVASLVQKLLSCSLDAVKPGLPKGTTTELQQPSWCSSSTLATRLILPINCRKELSRGIQHTNNLIIYSTLAIMEVTLRRYQFLVSLAKQDNASSSVISPADLAMELRFLLPSPEALVSLLLKLCASVDKVALIYVRALVVFRLYLECLPQVMSEVKLDFTKILAWSHMDPAASSSSSSSRLQSLIVSEILRFLLTVDANRLQVLLPSGASNNNNSANASSSKLLQLLHLYVETPNVAVRNLCGHVLHRTLSISTVFGTDTSAGEQIGFWLDSLRAAGATCAAFFERLVQNVLADPFQFLATYHARAGNHQQPLSLSPGTIALVSFLSKQPSATSSDPLAAHRSNPDVVVFGTRILLSLLPSIETPQQLVALITSSASASDGDDVKEEETTVATKRKRGDNDNATAANSVDAYAHLVEYCNALMSPASSSPQPRAHKKAKSSPLDDKKKKKKKGSAASWSFASARRSFASQLFSVAPEAFVVSWEQIVANAMDATGSFDLVFHYIGSWVGGDNGNNRSLLDLWSASVSSNKVGRRFLAELPLRLIVQSVLLCSSSSSQGDNVTSALLCIVKQRMDSGALDTTEAVRVCDLLLFALRYSPSISDNDGLSTLLLHVLSFLIVSTTDDLDGNALARFQIECIFRKLHAIADPVDQSKKPNNKLSALEITGLRLLDTMRGSSASASSWAELLLPRAGVPSVLLLSPLLPVALRIRLLHAFSSSKQTRSVQSVLVQHLMKSLDSESNTVTTTYASFAAYKKRKLLARRVWDLLERAAAPLSLSSLRQGASMPSFFASGFSIVGKLGGVDAAVAQNAVERTIVPVLMHSAASGNNRLAAATELLRRVVLSVRSEDGAVSLRAMSTFAATLGSVLATSLPNEEKTRSMALLTAVYSVFTRIESPELAKHASSLVPETLKALITSEVEEDTSRSNLSFVRSALLDHDKLPVNVASTVFQTLVKRFPDGTILSSNQLSSLLLLMRSSTSSSGSLHAFSKGAAEAAVVFLVKCALQSLTKLSKSKSDDKEAENTTDRVLSVVSTIVDDLVRRGVATVDSTALLKKLGPQLTRAQDYDYASVAAYRGFVKLSAVFLQLATSVDAAATTYSFADHLSAITEHSLFSTCLAAASRDHESDEDARLMLVRVVYWLVQKSAVYDRKLFKMLLGAYTMSLSAVDRALRVLLDAFDENAGISLAQFGFRFGSSSTTILSNDDVANVATAQHGQEAKAARTDLVDDSVWVVSGGLEAHRIRSTVEHFPLHRQVAVANDAALLSFDANVEDVDTTVSDGKSTSNGHSQVYDPAFLLPMLSHFISSSDLPEAAVVQQGLLGLAVRATSSYAQCTRAYAYGIVAHLHESLASSEALTAEGFKAGRQVHLLLESLRNAIESPRVRVSSVITVFLNDAISILCRPVHALFPHVNHFLLARQAIDVNDVPMFYALFNSRAPLTYKQERSWFLHTLRRGVRDDGDVVLLVRRHVLPILLSFFGSELADDHTQALIVQILSACLQTESGGAYLIAKSAFFEWLSARMLSDNNKTLKLTMELFAHALQTSYFQSDALDGAQQHALALQIVNTFAVLCARVQQCRSRDVHMDATLARIAALVVKHAQSACSLVTIRSILDAVVGAATAATKTHAMEEAETKVPLLLSLSVHGTSIDAALTAIDAIIQESLLQHPDLHTRTFGDWAQVLVTMAEFLAKVHIVDSSSSSVSAALDATMSQRAHAKVVLQRLHALLARSAPLSLKQHVLQCARDQSPIAYATLL